MDLVTSGADLEVYLAENLKDFNVPSDYKYIAVDDDLSIFAYSEDPVFIRESGDWCGGSSCKVTYIGSLYWDLFYNEVQLDFSEYSFSVEDLELLSFELEEPSTDKMDIVYEVILVSNIKGYLERSVVTSTTVLKDAQMAYKHEKDFIDKYSKTGTLEVYLTIKDQEEDNAS